MKLRELPLGSPAAKRRDELLAIMRDEARSAAERMEAATVALRLCYVKRAVVVRAEPGDAIQVSEEDYDLEDDRDLVARLLAAKGLVAKPLQ
jgi:hypothetical protein